jgi:hypothetical protein
MRAKKAGPALLLAALGGLALLAAGPRTGKAKPETATANAAAMTTSVGRPQGQPSGPVLLMPGPSGPIAGRLAKARAEAGTNGWTKGFWFGFGIRRLMGEHSSMGWYPWGGPEAHTTLDDLISGRKSPLEKKVAGDQAVRGTAASIPEAARSFTARRRGDEPERAVLRDIGILLRWAPGPAEFPADVRISNLNLPFDLEGLPFIWAGMATDAESLAYLIPLYARASRDEDKRSLLWAIGLHRDAPVVVPFVERVLAGKEKDEVRAEAASCLGEQNDAKALDLLLKTIKADPSEEVRDQAVEALTEMELPAAAAALISLASGGADGSVRREAVRGLADKATGATIQALVRIGSGDKDREVRKEAIHALADLPGRSGIPYLVDLAKTNPDRDVRQEAVGAIGDVGGAEAVKILTELARGLRR